MLAERTTRISTSPTLKVAAEALKLKQRGVDVVDLGAGEPDFATPEHVKAAAHAAIDADFTKYTSNNGTDELRGAICARYRADYGIECDPGQVMATAGGKQALFNAALALFGPGDDVVTHAPGWPSLVEQIRFADARPIVVRTHAEDGFALSPAAVLGALTPRTAGIVLNSPGNPTGALIGERELAEIADEAARRGIWIVLDLCYERLIYDPVPHNLPKVLYDRMRDRTVLAGSASKSFAMTGWRCGWMIAPPPVVAACSAIQSHATSNVCSITQKAVVAALTGPQECVTAMLDEYRERRDNFCAWLGMDPRFRVVKPAGAFYLFVDVSELLSPDGVRTSAQFAQALLDEARVAATAGEAFDAPGFLRLSYATSMDRLREGADRLVAFARSLERRADRAAASPRS